MEGLVIHLTCCFAVCQPNTCCPTLKRAKGKGDQLFALLRVALAVNVFRQYASPVECLGYGFSMFLCWYFYVFFSLLVLPAPFPTLSWLNETSLSASSRGPPSLGYPTRGLSCRAAAVSSEGARRHGGASSFVLTVESVLTEKGKT